MSFDYLFKEPLFIWLYAYFLFIALLESSKGLKKISHLFFYLSTFIFIFVIGFRWESGTDWPPYYELFNRTEFNYFSILNAGHFDVGYVILNIIVKLFTENYTIFLIIDAFIAIIVLAKLIYKLSPCPNFSYFIFYTNFFISQFIGSNRRMVALSIVLWVFYYFAVFKYKKGIFYLFISFIFHRSSGFNILAIKVPKSMFKPKTTIILIGISFLIGLSQIPVKIIGSIGALGGDALGGMLFNRMTEYATNSEAHIVTSTGSYVLSTTLALIKRMIFVVFYMLVASKYKIDSLTGFFYNIYIMSIVFYLGFLGTFFQMLSTYWAFIEILLMARFFNLINSKSKIYFLTYLALFGLLQINNALNVYPDLYIPYHFVWD